MGKFPHTDEARNAETTQKEKRQKMAAKEKIKMTDGEIIAGMKKDGIVEYVHGEVKRAKNLPVVKNVKVKVNGNKKEGEKRKANAFIVLVEIEGKGWFNENAVLHHYGFKTVSRSFKTYEKARIEADGILAKWGKSSSAKAKKDLDREDAIRKNVIAELAKMKPEQVAELLKRVA